ncbi:hypothetical protein FKM82_027147 [Ascaphus truei]
MCPGERKPLNHTAGTWRFGSWHSKDVTFFYEKTRPLCSLYFVCTTLHFGVLYARRIYIFTCAEMLHGCF